MDLQPGGVVDERVLLGAGGVTESRADAGIVLPAGELIEPLHELGNEQVVLRANLLNRHHVKAADDLAQLVDDVRLRGFGVAEDLNVERGDLDGAAGGWVPRLGRLLRWRERAAQRRGGRARAGGHFAGDDDLLDVLEVQPFEEHPAATTQNGHHQRRGK